MKGYTDFRLLQAKIVEEYMEKFKDSGSLTIARIIYRDHSACFNSVEAVRSFIRYRRGAKGEEARQQLKKSKDAREKQIRTT